MGYYINKNSKGDFIGVSFNEKLFNLINDGAKLIDKPSVWEEGLVCVINNGMFGAAAWAYDEDEMNCFLNTNGRDFQWLKFNKAKDLAE